MEKIAKKKILILGVSGLIGHMTYIYLSNYDSYEIYGLSKTRKVDSKTKLIDVENFKILEDYICKIKPDYVINAIGILISESENNLKKAINLNALLPHKLNYLAFEVNSN